MLKVLDQPFPGYLSSSIKTILLYTFYAGLCVTLVLVLFAPYGLSKLQLTTLLLHGVFFGLVTFIIAFANSTVLPLVMPGVFAEEYWTVRRELLMMFWNILSIALVNLLLAHLLYDNPIAWSGFLKIGAITISIGIFPVSLSIFIKQHLLLKQYYNDAKALDLKLNRADSSPIVENHQQEIVLNGENQGEKIKVSVDRLLYLESEQNYVKIVTESANPVLIRSTLKQAEFAVQSISHLYRCHRAYIVNLSKIKHVSGNAQGLKLHLSEDTIIPVSRNNSKETVALLEQMRSSGKP